jgi:hypothetical protein
MKKFFAYAAFAALLVGCTKEDTAPTTPTPDPNAIPKDNIRLVATLPTTGIQASDKFVLAGSFKTNEWAPAASTYTLVRQSDGKYRVDVPISAFDSDLKYKVVRNPTAAEPWKFGEKAQDCAEIPDRVLARTEANKSVAITIANFRNTGSCPD